MVENQLEQRPYYSYIYDTFLSRSFDEMDYIYRGNFTTNITEKILNLSELNINSAIEPSNIKKRVYYIMVECIQNITRYQENAKTAEETSSLFMISKKGSCFYVSTGNLIKTEKIDALRAQIDKVNSLDKEDLDRYFKEVLANEAFTDGGGAGLGLINMVRKSGNKLLYEFRHVNNQYAYFYLYSVISKATDYLENIHKKAFTVDDLKLMHDQFNRHNFSLLHCNVFKQDKLLGLMSSVEKQIDEKLYVKRKVFNILLELMQNVVHHAYSLDENIEGRPGIVYVIIQDDYYHIGAGNFVDNHNIYEIQTRMATVNDLAIDELQKVYDYQLLNFADEAYNKHGLGFMDMRLKTGKCIDYSIKKIDENKSFLLLEAQIKK